MLIFLPLQNFRKVPAQATRQFSLIIFCDTEQCTFPEVCKLKVKKNHNQHKTKRKVLLLLLLLLLTEVLCHVNQFSIKIFHFKHKPLFKIFTLAMIFFCS